MVQMRGVVLSIRTGAVDLILISYHPSLPEASGAQTFWYCHAPWLPLRRRRMRTNRESSRHSCTLPDPIPIGGYSYECVSSSGWSPTGTAPTGVGPPRDPTLKFFKTRTWWVEMHASRQVVSTDADLFQFHVRNDVHVGDDTKAMGREGGHGYIPSPPPKCEKTNCLIATHSYSTRQPTDKTRPPWEALKLWCPPREGGLRGRVLRGRGL